MRRMKKSGAAAGVIAAAALSIGSPALAGDDYVGRQPPQVGPSDVGGARSAQVLSAQGGTAVQQITPRATAGGLALTGTDIAGLTFIAAASVAGGIVLVRRARPTTA